MKSVESGGELNENKNKQKGNAGNKWSKLADTKHDVGEISDKTVTKKKLSQEPLSTHV